MKKQNGSAIIVALFVVSLTTVSAVAMLSRLSLDVRRTQLILNANEANFIAQGSIDWAMEQLKNDWKNQKPNQLIDRTPIQSKVDEMNGYHISSTIDDMQIYFNINNLSVPNEQENFIQLLRNIEPKLEHDKAKEIAFNISDWIGASTKNDEYYAKLSPPYRPSHHLMVSVSELRLVKGISAELYQKLMPFITALPEHTNINVNHVSLPVLMSLSPTLTIDAAKTILLHGRQTPFMSVQNFLDFDIVKNNGIPANKVTVVSQYFLVKTNVSVGQQNTILYTLLLRRTQGTEATITPLWQTKGTL